MQYTFAALLLSAAALAQADGFNGPGDRPQPATAAEAATLPDDAKVTLSGYIVRSLGDEQYEFRDATGTLVVEIDDDEWQGAEITPNDPVELTGEIDHEGQDLELEVDHIRLTQAQ
jgi:uncharacterized protein (TIGR00156 family)